MTDTSRQRHPMTPPPRNPEQKRHKASGFAKQKEKHSTAVFQQLHTERVISDAKTAKLRALRLAKEEADRCALASEDETLASQPQGDEP